MRSLSESDWNYEIIATLFRSNKYSFTSNTVNKNILFQKFHYYLKNYFYSITIYIKIKLIEISLFV